MLKDDGAVHGESGVTMRRGTWLQLVGVAVLASGLGASYGCGASCAPAANACSEPPPGLVQIPAADGVPDASSQYAVNCIAPVAGDVAFCTAINQYVGKTYDPATHLLGPSIGQAGQLTVLSTTSNCETTCTGKTVLGLHLSVDAKVCTVKAGAGTSSSVSSAHTTELQKHISSGMPNGDDQAGWSLTSAPAELKAFCLDPSYATTQIVLELWTGKIEIETTAHVDTTADAKVCCGSVFCFDAPLDASGTGDSRYTFDGTVGVKLASRDDFCNGARDWLAASCQRTPEAGACSDGWWRG